MKVAADIQKEIDRVEAEIERQKHAVKHCMNDSEQMHQTVLHLRELHTRLAQLKDNLRGTSTSLAT